MQDGPGVWEVGEFENLTSMLRVPLGTGMTIFLDPNDL